MPKCLSCGTHCKTAKCLIDHQSSDNSCQKYQDIIFMCRRCKFHTKGIKNIESHINCCTGENTENPLDVMEGEKKLLEDKNIFSTSKILEYEKKIERLQSQLTFELLKNKIYSHIISTQTNIKLENIIQESEAEVNIYNFEKGNIPIIIHEFNSDNKLQVKRKNKSPKLNVDGETKNSFRRVKHLKEIKEEELDSKLQKNTSIVVEQVNQIMYNNFDVSLKDISKQIEQLMEQIEISRIYTKHLQTIKITRRKLLGKLGLDEYISIISTHIRRLEIIFQKKGYDTGKIITNISKSLTPLDMRLVYYTNYTNTTIDVEEVQNFGLAMDMLITYPKYFEPYDKLKTFKNMKNYTLALFELVECINKNIVNRYGFHNVIYLNNEKSLDADPFSFYTLEKCDLKSRSWKMECRLEDFTIDFIDNIRPYCVGLFKKLYKDVFNDNMYRSDYLHKAQITENDCEQLMQNIILLAQPMKLCKIIQNIIKTKCTFTKTNQDKQNLYADCPQTRKRFATPIVLNEDIYYVMRQVFDVISDDDIEELLSTR